MVIILYMPPWQTMWLCWLLCYPSYRAGIFFKDFTTVECLFDKHPHPLPKVGQKYPCTVTKIKKIKI